MSDIPARWEEEGLTQSPCGWAEQKEVEGTERGGEDRKQPVAQRGEMRGKKESGWKRCTRAASVLVLQGQITLFAVWVGAGDLRHEARAMRRQAGLSQWCCWAPILCQPGLSLGMIAGRGWGTVFVLFFSPFRIAELYAAGRCWRTLFERAVICDWTQCATWSLLRLLLPRLLPSPSPPAVFGRWSWLRGWASPRCVAVTEWKVRPINSTMGAKQMKWWESDFTVFQRCYFNVRMMLLLFFSSIFFFFCLRCTRSRNNTVLWAIKQGIIYMQYILFW